MTNQPPASRFCNHKGILLAADLEDEKEAMQIVDACADSLAGIKLGNRLLYRYGPSLITRFKNRFGLPVVADIKLTDVAHIAMPVAESFAQAGADAVTVSGICGQVVLRAIVQHIDPTTEIWLFTEFTDPQGLIPETDVERTTRLGQQAGARGFQAPGNRPGRVRILRQRVGPYAAIMSCGIGAQGGRVGSALDEGANFEIIGRWIYDDPQPRQAARRLIATLSSMA